MKLWRIACLLLVVFLGCVDNAPRDNPLDPFSPLHKGEGSLAGRVIVVRQTISWYEIQGVAGATVLHTESGIFVTTDSAGYFLFNKLPEGAQTFVCQKNNFTNDTFQVKIEAEKTVTVERWLNGAPVALSKNVVTRTIDYAFRSPDYFVDVEAIVTDPNGYLDIDSVWCSFADTVLFPMNRVGVEKFTVSVHSALIPTGTLHWLTGKPLRIVSRDGSKAVNISEPFFISRIIENGSTPLSPAVFDSVSRDSVVFMWEPANAVYNYTSLVDLYQAGTEIKQWTSSPLPSSTEEIALPESVAIEPRNYFWTVTLVDEFGNSFRSKESYFVVK